MKHEYYGYDKEALLKNPKMKLFCMKDNYEVFRQMAEQMAEEIKNHNARGERTVFICPVGPVGQYSYFVEMVNEENISLKRGISADHPLSFRGFMDRNVYSKIRPELIMPSEQRIFPDPDNLSYIPELIERLGGVDIVFGGIGISGHVAFNEADWTLSVEEFLAQKTRVLKISPETRAANAIGDLNGALEDMPSYCVTVGIHEIAHAGKIRLGCFRNWHRAVVRRAGYGEPTPEFPVSLLQNHPDITLTFTEFVAALTD